jgi:hypothetical protein
MWSYANDRGNTEHHTVAQSRTVLEPGIVDAAACPGGVSPAVIRTASAVSMSCPSPLRAVEADLMSKRSKGTLGSHLGDQHTMITQSNLP